MSRPPAKLAPRHFMKDVFSVSSSRMVVLIANLTTSVIVARLLGVEGKGLLTAVLLGPQMIATLAEFGVRQASAYHAGQGTWSTDRIAQTTLATALLTGAIGAVLSVVWLSLNWETHYTVSMLVMAALMVPATVMSSSVAGLFLGLQRLPNFSVSLWGPGVCKLLGTFAFVVVASWGVPGAIAAAALSPWIVSTIMLIALSRVVDLRVHFHVDIAKGMWALGSSYAVVYFLMALTFKANLILVQHFSGIESLGYYSLSSNLAELLWQVPSALGVLVFARSAGAQDTREFALKVAVLARQVFLLGLLGAGVMAALAPMVIPLLYGDVFRPSVSILLVLLPGTVAMMVFKILRQDLAGRGQPWAAGTIILGMLSFTVALGSWLIPQYGPLGAAVNISSTYILGTVALVIQYARCSNISVSTILSMQRSDFSVISRIVKR